MHTGSPLPLPPLQDESSVDPANTPPQEWSEASVKESLDAVPEAMLYSPTSSDGGAGKSGAENQVSTDVDRAMDTTTGSDPSIGQVLQLVPEATSCCYNCLGAESVLLCSYSRQ